MPLISIVPTASPTPNTPCNPCAGIAAVNGGPCDPSSPSFVGSFGYWRQCGSAITCLPPNRSCPPSNPVAQNCSQCGGGQNSGSCAGCPATPPGYVTTGTGPPISTSSGLPFGFGPGSPVNVVGLTLPAWIWGAGLAVGYFALKGRKH